MKLSPFMKEYKKDLKKMSKKQLIDQVFIQTEYIAQNDYRMQWLRNQVNEIEQQLQSAENALDYKEKVIDKYKKLLEVSIEDL